ncbi:unnamed protein product, partial [Ranitomeya imitator]
EVTRCLLIFKQKKLLPQEAKRTPELSRIRVGAALTSTIEKSCKSCAPCQGDWPRTQNAELTGDRDLEDDLLYSASFKFTTSYHRNIQGSDIDNYASTTTIKEFSGFKKTVEVELMPLGTELPPTKPYHGTYIRQLGL